MIHRLLIANRGEIARRIAAACRELGIESVAVYSEADSRAPHRFAADRSVRIGPAVASESYLKAGALIDAARASGADAIHPGYGFLSENADFAAACADAGLTFVGPPADVIARMGSKIEARRVAEAAGVPVVPGGTPRDQSDAGVRHEAMRIGFPVLVKASAGGGGKGMRTVRTEAELDAAIPAARREATAAFGDGTLYVERLVDRPRHVEVQVFGDHDGQVVHLFERECSVQRRHQKIIEESPSPALTPAVRGRMTQAALAAARAVGYRNAGTIEFLLDGTGDDARFYFLEMNTRLQVEHPVTEAVTGVDLVRAQIEVAAGGRLPWRQDELTQRGHAIECRVYAEDPSQGFIPQAGPLLLYREPVRPGIRVDSGVVEGGAVSIYYDPMLAKLIAAGESREAARARAIAALRAYAVLGIRTNIPFLLQILGHPRFKDADIDTGFLDREGPAFVAGLAGDGTVPPPALAAAATFGGQPAGGGARSAARAGVVNDPWVLLTNWRG
ncbi:MAG TPA: biotin carboxylase N-terminal domain-containing protein [Vicinamibacterales bacterium]|nr:biotin carboxylase N-terminal domain-containing protein [Vicinamibacterales bacterium]